MSGIDCEPCLADQKKTDTECPNWKYNKKERPAGKTLSSVVGQDKKKVYLGYRQVNRNEKYNRSRQTDKLDGSAQKTLIGSVVLQKKKIIYNQLQNVSTKQIQKIFISINY